ncbi:MAG TPA: glycoside hydrolase family 25 protein [Anaerolineaceae bacterium]|nr:glycoside hydrolase family 25 protein [Anaerolineaceae bacterium]
MPSANLPFGIDVSVYDGTVNWDVVAAHSIPQVVFAGTRATVSWGYIDPQFSRNWSEAKRVSAARMARGSLPIYRCAYHVVYPGEDAVRQIDHFMSVVGADHGELPLVLDVELDQGLGHSAIADKVLACIQELARKAGRIPNIYSRALWVDEFITGYSNGKLNTPPDWLNFCDWWLAQYLKTPDEDPGPPNLPQGVDRARVVMQQTTDQGKPIGVASLSADYDRWQGDQASLETYAS